MARRRPSIGRTEETDPHFFDAADEFRAWLERHHQDVGARWVGLYKQGSGRPSMTWTESVDQALCFGWIDGVRRAVDASAYVVRFRPRKATGKWSQKNLARFDELCQNGLVYPAGEAAFAARGETVVAWYSYENELTALDNDAVERFRADHTAWAYFERQSPSYRRAATYWVVSARRPETRARRLDLLMASSAAGMPAPPLSRPNSRN